MKHSGRGAGGEVELPDVPHRRPGGLIDASVNILYSTASATAMMHSIWKAAGLLGSHIPPCAAFTLRLTRPVDPFVFSHTRNDMSMELLWLCRDYGLALCSFPPSMLQCFSKSRRVVSTVTQYIMVLGTLRSRGPKPA
mmetsp:Transcript_22126/g.61420  ORF Transcript_22126/g.61420 Transcript_22126/m.61420 type:complete len:138 (-) Transcript_22126:1361-1774(-)